MCGRLSGMKKFSVRQMFGAWMFETAAVSVAHWYGVPYVPAIVMGVLAGVGGVILAVE